MSHGYTIAGALVALVLLHSCAAIRAADTKNLTRCEEALSMGVAFVNENVVIPQDQTEVALCAATALDKAGRRHDAEVVLLRLVVQSRDRSTQAEALARLGQMYARNQEVDGLTWAFDQLCDVCANACEPDPFLALAGPILQIARSDFERGDLERSLSLSEKLRSAGKSLGYRGDYFDPPWLPRLYARLGRQEEAEQLYVERIQLAPNEEIRARREEEYRQFLDTQRRSP